MFNLLSYALVEKTELLPVCNTGRDYCTVVSLLASRETQSQRQSLQSVSSLFHLPQPRLWTKGYYFTS